MKIFGMLVMQMVCMETENILDLTFLYHEMKIVMKKCIYKG